jgi:hypothetical protein
MRHPIVGANTAAVNSTWEKNRIHTTCKTGKDKTNHLALVSKLANIKVVRVTSAIPIFRFLELSPKSCVMYQKVSDLEILYPQVTNHIVAFVTHMGVKHSVDMTISV